MHSFEDEDNFIWQTLEQKADLLEIDLISPLQELYFIFSHWCTKRLGRVNGTIGEKQGKIAEVFADAQSGWDWFNWGIVHGDHRVPEPAKIESKIFV